MPLLVLVVGPEGPERAERAAAVRALGHAVVEAGSPAEVPLDLSPEFLVCDDPAVDAAYGARLGPVASGAEAPAGQGRLLVLSDALVDLRGRRVFRPDGRQEALLDKEAALLAYLVARPDVVVARGDLLADVWGYAPTMRTRTIDNTVRRLRTRIEADPGQPDHVVTVRGGGYRFVPLAGAPTQAATPPAPSPAPRPSGTLVVGSLRARSTMSLYGWLSSAWSEVRHAVLEPLVSVDAAAGLHLGPLEAIEVAGDGRSAVLRLRPAVWFHARHGLPAAEATADDLLVSLGLASEARHLTLPLAGDPERVDERSVRLVFTRPVGPLGQRLLQVCLVPARLPELDDVEDLAWPVGSGPFRFAAPAQGEGLELVAHEAHWRASEGSVPGVARLHVRYVRGDEWQGAVAAVASGSLDLASLTNQPDLEPLAAGCAAAGVRLARFVDTSSHSLTCLVWLRGGPAGVDRATRQALHHAVDRQVLADADPKDVDGTARFLPAFAMAFDPAFELPPPCSVVAPPRAMTVGVFWSDLPMSEALVAELERLGVTAQVVQIGNDALAEQLSAPSIDAVIMHLTRSFWGRDPFPFVEAMVRSSADFGVLGPDAIELLDALAGEARRRDRIARLRALVAHLHHEVPAMPLLVRRVREDRFVVSPRVRGFDDPGTGRVIPRDVADYRHVTVDWEPR